jgi:hypothetical protein
LTLYSCFKHFFLDNISFIIGTFRLNIHNPKTILISPIPIHIYENSSSEINNQTFDSALSKALPQYKPNPTIQPSYTHATMCRARLTTYLLCGCIHRHQDLCTHALKASTKVEWDAVHVCSDWDRVSTQVHESVNKRCPLHAKEFLERGGGAAAARG